MSGIPLADGWRLGHDGRGALFEAPRGALRLSPELADVIAGDRDPGLVMHEALGALLACLGAHRDRPAVEPERPPAPEQGPAVTVVIPNLDGRVMLDACLESLGRQAYADLTVTVVDGGSTDGSQAAARERGADVLDVPRGTGFAAACNAGVAASTGDLLLFLNNDTTLEPDAVGQLVRAGRRVGKRPVAAVTAMIRRGDLRAVIESLGNVFGPQGFGAGRYAGYIDLGQLKRERELFSAPFTAVLVGRGAWETVGELVEDYGFYYEDVDWSLRARLAGMRVLAAPHALVYHEGSASTAVAVSVDKEQLVTRNRLLCVTRTLGPRTAVRFARSYVSEDARRALAGVRAGSRREAAMVAAAWAGAARALPAALASRRTLPARRRTSAQLLALAASPPPLMDGPYPLLTRTIIRESYLGPLRASSRAGG